MAGLADTAITLRVTKPATPTVWPSAACRPGRRITGCRQFSSSLQRGVCRDL